MSLPLSFFLLLVVRIPFVPRVAAQHEPSLWFYLHLACQHYPGFILPSSLLIALNIILIWWLCQWPAHSPFPPKKSTLIRWGSLSPKQLEASAFVSLFLFCFSFLYWGSIGYSKLGEWFFVCVCPTERKWRPVEGVALPVAWCLRWGSSSSTHQTWIR